MQSRIWVYVHVIPHLTQLRISVIHTPLARRRGIIPRAAAPEVRDCAGCFGQGGLQCGGAVAGAVGRGDAGGVEPAPGGEAPVVEDCGGEEVENVGVVGGEGPVAGEAG